MSKKILKTVKFLDKVLRVSEAVDFCQSLHDNLKERDQTNMKKFNSGCGFQETYYFTHNGKLDGPGGRQGKCGYKKDHARNYCCKKCFKEGRHKKLI